MKRVHLIISGDVVGVGFRSWVREKAKMFGIVGWVQNREDKTVEIMAEGKNLEAFVKECGRGPDVSWVQQVDTTWLPGTGEFASFEVLY